MSKNRILGKSRKAAHLITVDKLGSDKPIFLKKERLFLTWLLYCVCALLMEPHLFVLMMTLLNNIIHWFKMNCIEVEELITI